MSKWRKPVGYTCLIVAIAALLGLLAYAISDFVMAFLVIAFIVVESVLIIVGLELLLL